jgi:hypothetical protein
MKTRQRVRYESIEEPLDDEERELMNPDNWDWDNPVDVAVSKHPLAQLPIDFTFDEIKIIEKVARAVGMSPHAFIKQAALKAAIEH